MGQEAAGNRTMAFPVARGTTGRDPAAILRRVQTRMHGPRRTWTWDGSWNLTRFDPFMNALLHYTGMARWPFPTRQKKRSWSRWCWSIHVYWATGGVTRADLAVHHIHGLDGVDARQLGVLVSNNIQVSPRATWMEWRARPCPCEASLGLLVV